MMRLLLGLAVVSMALAQPTPETIESFEKVWNTVQDKHWNPKYLEKLPNGKSWTQIHNEYSQSIRNAKTDIQARQTIKKMLGELGQSHYAIIAGDPDDDLQPVRGGEATTGIDPMLLDGKILVRGVPAGTPAALTAVRPGWEITKIDDFDVRAATTRVLAKESSLSHREMILRSLVLGHLSGLSDSPVRVMFADGSNNAFTKTIRRRKPNGTVSRFGLLPPQVVEFQTRRVRPDTGYIRFSLFLDPSNLMAKFENAVKSCLKCRGMVIDLRGNPGGLAILASGMSGFFIETPDTKLGTLYQRNLELKLVVNPRIETFTGKLAILVDATSVSTSEIMAGGLQDLKRARIFGTTTAGAALPSMVERLPDGDLFQYAMANYISEGGKTLEGRGVIPDVVVKTTRSELLSGRDPVLDAAINWIYAQKP